MKRATASVLLSTLIILSLPALILAQILNGGFEEWTGSNPDNWVSNNALGVYETISQSNSNHSGSFSVKGEVINYLDVAIPPLLMSGATAEGFSVSEKYLSLTGYYEFAPVGGDQLDIIVWMFNNSTLIGGGFIEIMNSAPNYTAFSVGIEYFNLELTPDNVMISVTISHSVDVHSGSEFKLDDLSLSMTPTGIETANSVVPSSVILNQNYPNPFNPATTIGFSLTQGSEVSLTIYDITGAEVVKLIDRQNMAAGYHSIQWQPNANVPSGVYFYRLAAGNFLQTRRTLYIK